MYFNKILFRVHKALFTLLNFYLEKINTYFVMQQDLMRPDLRSVGTELNRNELMVVYEIVRELKI